MSDEAKDEEAPIGLKLDLGSIPEYHSVDAEELSGILKEGKKKALIVDVRDSDFAGGHITGAVNVPSQTFDQKKGELIKTVEAKKPDVIVFNCMYCRERGPQCALTFVTAWKDKHGKDKQQPNVCILRGGFQAWINHCNDMQEKPDASRISKGGVEKLDLKMWGSTPSQGLVYKKDLEAENFALGDLSTALGSLSTPKNASSPRNKPSTS